LSSKKRESIIILKSIPFTQNSHIPCQHIDNSQTITTCIYA